MISRHCFLLLLLLSAFFARALGDTMLSSDEVRAAYLVSFGRAPTTQELAKFPVTSEVTLVSLLEQLKQQLAGNVALQREVATKAQRDAFGTEKSDARGATKELTYFERVAAHVRFLAANPADYAAVQKLAYLRAIGRDVYPEEQEYWKKFEVIPYALLVGSVDNWARRNQPGLMVTAGTPSLSVNSVFLLAARLDPETASALRTALGSSASVDGRSVIAPGAGILASDGRMHFVAVGRD